MKVEVYAGRCEGHGMCELTAPEVYALDDDGVVSVRVDPIPDSLSSQASAGARVCPVAALRIIP